MGVVLWGDDNDKHCRWRGGGRERWVAEIEGEGENSKEVKLFKKFQTFASAPSAHTKGPSQQVCIFNVVSRASFLNGYRELGTSWKSHYNWNWVVCCKWTSTKTRSFVRYQFSLSQRFKSAHKRSNLARFFKCCDWKRRDVSRRFHGKVFDFAKLHANFPARTLFNFCTYILIFSSSEFSSDIWVI